MSSSLSLLEAFTRFISVAVGAKQFTSGQTTCSVADDVNVTVPADYTGNIVISKEGYYPYTMPESLSGAMTTVTMTPKTVTTPFVQTFLVDKCKGDYRSYANVLLDSEVIYAAGVSGTPETRRLYPSVNWNGHGEGTVWLQQGDASVLLAENAFTEVAFDARFAAKQAVYLCAKAADGTMMKTKVGLNLYEGFNTGVKVNLGKSLNIPKNTSNDNTDILPNNSLEIELSDKMSEISFTVKDDGTVEGVIGLKPTEEKDTQAVFGDTKELMKQIKDCNQRGNMKRAAEMLDEWEKNMQSQGIGFPCENASFGVSGKLKMIGYFTGNLFDGRLGLTESEIMMDFEGDLEYTHNTIIMGDPVYFQMTLGASIKHFLKMVYNENVKQLESDGKNHLDGSLKISAEVGEGWKKYISGGVKGEEKINLYTTIPVAKENTQATLQGSLYFVGTLCGTEGEWKIAECSEPEMIFWDAGQFTWKKKEDTASLSEFIPDLRMQTMTMLSDSTGDGTIASGVSGYTAPCLTLLPDGKLLAVWVANAPGRKAVDKNGLFYSVCGADGIWSAAKMIWDDKTGDSAPILQTVGSDVWILWQNNSKVFDNDTLENPNYNTMAEQIDIAAAKFDTVTGMFKAGNTISCAGYDYFPQLSQQNGLPTLAWRNGSGSLYSATCDAGTWSVPSAQTKIDWYKEETQMPSTYKGQAPTTTSSYQTFGTDCYQAILYTAENENEINNVYGLFNDGFGWGTPVQLTDLHEGSVGGFQAVLDENGKNATILANIRHTNAAGEYTSSDLKIYKKNLEPNITVANADYVRESFVPGGTLTLTASVKNNSGKTISGLKYTVLDGTTELSSGYCDMTLLPGQTKTAYMNYDLPSTFSADKLTMNILPRIGSDIDTTDNSAECTLKTTDLSVENVRAAQTRDGTQIVAQLVNRGKDASGEAAVTFRAGTPDGAVLSTQTISTLASGAATNLIVNSEKLKEGEMVYVEAQTLQNENLLGNNINQAAVLDETSNGLNLDVISDCSGRELSLSIAARNSTTDAANCRVVAAAYDQNGRLLDAKTIDKLNLRGLQDDGATVKLAVPSGKVVYWKVLLLDYATNVPLTTLAAGEVPTV